MRRFFSEFAISLPPPQTYELLFTAFVWGVGRGVVFRHQISSRWGEEKRWGLEKLL